MLDPFNLRTASTANFAKCSLSTVRSLLESVVLAIFNKSALKASKFYELSKALKKFKFHKIQISLNFFNATSRALRHPAITC